MTMRLEDVAHYRLANQQISHPGKMPRDVVFHLGAMQAQDYPGALWSVGLRSPGSTRSDVEKVLAEREVVRTWPLRGTLHLVAAEDVRWMLNLTSPRVIAGTASRVRNLELNDEVFGRGKDIFVEALRGGKRLTRGAMCRRLEDAGISTKGQRGIHILRRLSQEGLLCLGPQEGKEPTFVLLEEWAPRAKSLPRDQALATIARRYFTGHGPATVQDFARWAGLAARDAKAGLEMVESALASETVDGKTYWMGRALAPSERSPSVYLLPGFDEYMLGYKDRSAALPEPHSQKIVPGGNGMFLPTIVSSGAVVGLWKRKVRKNSITIEPRLFEADGELDEELLAAAARRYGEFVGAEVGL